MIANHTAENSKMKTPTAYNRPASPQGMSTEITTTLVNVLACTGHPIASVCGDYGTPSAQLHFIQWTSGPYIGEPFAEVRVPATGVPFIGEQEGTGQAPSLLPLRGAKTPFYMRKMPFCP